jgi:hypothetical protein
MKYDNLPTITPAAVYEAQRDGAKFIRLSGEQADAAIKAGKKLYLLEYETELKKVVCVGVYVKVSDLIKIAL